MNMSDKKNIQEELKDLSSPILAQWQGKAEEWSMPDGYLNHLSNEIIAKSEQPQKVKLIHVMQKKSWQIAASILFLVAATGFFMNNGKTQYPSNTLASLENISTEEIQIYVLDNIDEFDVELLEEYALEDNGEYLDLKENWLEDQSSTDLF